MKAVLWMKDMEGKSIKVGDFVMVYFAKSSTQMVGKVRSLKKVMDKIVARLIWSDGSSSHYSYRSSDLKHVEIEDML